MMMMIFFFLSHTSFHRPTVCSRLPRFCLSDQLQHYSSIFLTTKKTVADMLAPASRHGKSQSDDAGVKARGNCTVPTQNGGGNGTLARVHCGGAHVGVGVTTRRVVTSSPRELLSILYVL